MKFPPSNNLILAKRTPLTNGTLDSWFNLKLTSNLNFFFFIFVCYPGLLRLCFLLQPADDIFTTSKHRHLPRRSHNPLRFTAEVPDTKITSPLISLLGHSLLSSVFLSGLRTSTCKNILKTFFIMEKLYTQIGCYCSKETIFQ